VRVALEKATGPSLNRSFPGRAALGGGRPGQPVPETGDRGKRNAARPTAPRFVSASQLAREYP